MKTSRSYSDIMAELNKIAANAIDHKTQVMAEALAWGYGSARTNYILESRLYHHPRLSQIVKTLAEKWNGEDYLNGALYVANHTYTGIYEG